MHNHDIRLYPVQALRYSFYILQNRRHKGSLPFCSKAYSVAAWLTRHPKRGQERVTFEMPAFPSVADVLFFPLEDMPLAPEPEAGDP